MKECFLCTENKGKRICIIIGDWLCPHCCGQARVIKIECWRYCPFFLGSREGIDNKRGINQNEA